MFEDLTNLGISELLEEAQVAKAAKDSWQDYSKRVMDEIVFRKQAEIDLALQAKDDPFGTIHVDGLKFTVPKTVIWDQEKMYNLYNEIGQSGEDVNEYIAVTYKVKEAKFKTGPKISKTLLSRHGRLRLVRLSWKWRIGMIDVVRLAKIVADVNKVLKDADLGELEAKIVLFTAMDIINKLQNTKENT